MKNVLKRWIQKKIWLLCVLAVGMFLPGISGQAQILLGTPTREAFLQMGREYLEQYNFSGIHINSDARKEEAVEDIDRTEAEAKQEQGTPFVPEHYILVGDSRFVGMRDAVGDAGCTWICQLSAGLSWFTETAVPQIDEAVQDKTVIIINMGVNDLGNVMGYADILEQKVPEWMAKGAVVYYMSVNPIENHAYISNDDVITFNNTLYNVMPQEMGWIETNAYLHENGYTAPDGLHYDGATYQTIFNYCMEVISGFHSMY